MTKEIKKELMQAKKLYKSGKREEAYEIYNKHYVENPDNLKRWDLIRYCWSIYYLFIRDSTDENELMKCADMVTDMVKQEDLNKSPVCVYTQCVFKAIMFLKDNSDWEYMLYWLDKLDPELLNDVKGKSGDIIYPSKKEEYYKFKSKAFLECGDYEDCISTSKEALNMFSTFALNGDTWHRWNIAKALKQLNRPEEALVYLEEVIKVQRDWFILKEFAEDYYLTGDIDNAMKYGGEAVLTDDPANIKVNLYYLIYKILKDSNYEWALKHAQLYLALKLEGSGFIADEIEHLDIDINNLNANDFELEIKRFWSKSEKN